MKRVVFGVGIALLCVAGPAMAQSDGYLGVYGDVNGTIRCPSAPPWVLTTLYVVATAAGASAAGIAGAEFRIEVENPSGYFFSYIAPDSAQVLGDPLSPSGSNITWPSCRVGNGAGKINLGTIHVFNMGGAPTNIIVKHKEPPTNVDHNCPLLVLCDEPTYTLRCSTAPQDSISCLNR